MKVQTSGWSGGIFLRALAHFYGLWRSLRNQPTPCALTEEPVVYSPSPCSTGSSGRSRCGCAQVVLAVPSAAPDFKTHRSTKLLGRGCRQLSGTFAWRLGFSFILPTSVDMEMTMNWDRV